MDPQPDLVFASPSIQEEFGTPAVTMLAFAFLAMLVIGGISAWAIGGPWAATGLVVVILLATASLAAALGSTRGSVVLDTDGLVETNIFHASRRFAYEQILAVQLGAHAHSLEIYYYPQLQNGMVDTLHPRRTRIVSVKDAAALQTALARRVTAPRNETAMQKDRQAVMIFLSLLLAVSAVLVFWALALQ